MDGLGLGLAPLTGEQLLSAQIGNTIFSPGRGFPFAEFRDGRKAPIYDERLQGSFHFPTCSNCILDGAFAPSFFIFRAKCGEIKNGCC